MKEHYKTKEDYKEKFLEDRKRAEAYADIQRFMRQLGANSSDPVALANNIRRLKTTAHEDFANRYYATRNERWQGSFEPVPAQPPSATPAPVAGTPDFSR